MESSIKIELYKCLRSNRNVRNKFYDECQDIVLRNPKIVFEPSFTIKNI